MIMAEFIPEENSFDNDPLEKCPAFLGQGVCKIISAGFFCNYEIMRAHGGTMEIRAKEDEDSRIIPGISYRVIM